MGVRNWKFLGRCLLILLALCLALSMAIPALAQGDVQEANPVSHDPSFYREFGVFYDQAHGDVYVSDSLANRIIRTKMDGTGWTTLGSLGSGTNQFRDPRGIYFDGTYVYVTDTGNHRVVKTKMDGSVWQTIGSQGTGDKQLYYPRGIWVDGTNLYIPDTANNRIVKTSTDMTGNVWTTLGTAGIGPKQLLTPRGVVVNGTDLYIADTANNRIVKTSTDMTGNVWTTLGTAGSGAKQFRGPRGISLNTTTNDLYVADDGNNRIVKTQIDGSGWTTYGSFGNGTGQFFYPRGISFDNSGSGDVYVADTFNDRIVKTKIDGTGWQSLGTKWKPYVWYFAEGTTRQNFDMYLTLCNPGSTDAIVDITYMLGDGSQIPQRVTVAAHSRYTINVNAVVGDNKDVSIRVLSDQPVIAERPMYFNYGKGWPGGHDVMGKPTLDTKFYFAEGTTRDGFNTYLCIQNPGASAANVKVTYMFPDSSTQVQTAVVPAHSRQTINVNQTVGAGKDLSIVVESDVPILCERPMYFKYKGRITGGHVVIGATEPDTHFFLAEGTTRAGFEEYLCVLNPGSVAANVHFRYMFGDGTIKEQDLVIPATSRQTVNVNDVVGSNKDVAVEITSDQPIVVERPMYFVYKGLIFGGHDVMAVSDLGSTFYFAEGTTRPGFEEWICILNPSDDVSSVTITYMFSDGTTKNQDVTVGAHSRATLSVKDNVPAGQDVSLAIQASNPIVVERPIYFNYNGKTTGGSDAMGFSE